MAKRLLLSILLVNVALMVGSMTLPGRKEDSKEDDERRQCMRDLERCRATSNTNSQYIVPGLASCIAVDERCKNISVGGGREPGISEESSSNEDNMALVVFKNQTGANPQKTINNNPVKLINSPIPNSVNRNQNRNQNRGNNRPQVFDFGEEEMFNTY